MPLINQANQEAARAAPQVVKAADGSVPSVPVEEKVNYQAKKRKLDYEAALTIQAVLKRSGITLSEAEQSAIDRLTKKPGQGGGSTNFGKPVIFKIFGDTPRVGSKATALEVFSRTGKGFQEVKQLIKKWAEKGTIVIYDGDSKTYTLTKLGTLPANVE